MLRLPSTVKGLFFSGFCLGLRKTNLLKNVFKMVFGFAIACEIRTCRGTWPVWSLREGLQSKKLTGPPTNLMQRVRLQDNMEFITFKPGKIVLYLLIIGILGWNWDEGYQLGSIPSSCHPKPRPTTPTVFLITWLILYQKEKRVCGVSENII